MSGVKVFVLAAALAIVMLVVPARSEVIRFGVATEPYPPFTKKDVSGHWVGFEIDLMIAICAEMKAKCEIVETPWEGIIPALQAGKFDVIWSSMTITELRKTAIDFSDKIYQLPNLIIGPKSESLTIDFSNPESVRGKVIGVHVGTTNADFLRKFFGATAVIKACSDYAACFDEAKLEHMDLLIADALDASDFLHSEAGKDWEVKATAPRDRTLGLGVGAGFRKSDTWLRVRFNAVLADLHRDGTYERIARMYFNFDPYSE